MVDMAAGSNSLTGTAVLVLGTRPEIVKLAPVARHLPDRVRVVHTGQHYDHDMSDIFFDECELRRPETTLAIGGKPRGAQIGLAVQALDELFGAQRPAVVLVQGDTNSVVAGALAANAHDIPLIHVEAGLRSRDRRMPEEHNRIIADHLATVLCAATELNVENLRAEGIPADRIALTGNTIVDAVNQALPAEGQRAKVLAEHGLQADRFVLATIHRPENTDDPAILTTVISELAALTTAGWPVLFPAHPRTRAALYAADCQHLLAGLIVTEPLGYAEFLALAAEAALVVSDSGGVQEEVTVLKRPLIVVRRSTERPEALRDFARLMPPGTPIADEALTMLASASSELQRLSVLESPFGDAHAGAHIARIVERFLRA
ncbi:UDP-N-acetylglucosamine 2-epimerase (non-hydrolyzing) [Catenulispora sp. GAS73]